MVMVEWQYYKTKNIASSLYLVRILYIPSPQSAVRSPQSAVRLTFTVRSRSETLYRAALRTYNAARLQQKHTYQWKNIQIISLKTSRPWYRQALDCCWRYISPRDSSTKTWNTPSLQGQHSLTSVEGPSYLRSDFVNLWRHARLKVFDTLKYVIHLHFDRLYPTCLIFGERFCPTFLIIPRLIPIYSNKKMPLPSFKGCFDVSSLFLLCGEKDLSVDVTK